jgi:putative glycosyltransferase (TIGR04348 family)
MQARQKKSIVVVTPALPQTNNGNGHTAARWSAFLREKYHVTTVLSWQGEPADAMIALHARRSADSIAQFAKTKRPIAVVLTGTDLYRDIFHDASAKQSLQLANRIVTLQPAGLATLDPGLQKKGSFVYQSAPLRTKLAPRKTRFDLVMVGHIRSEKDPLTALRAVQTLKLPALRLQVIGKNSDDALGRDVAALVQLEPRIAMMGELDHPHTRRAIARARLLLLPSVMEGGANVLIEAVTCGTPVLASRVDGNIGMLGPDYEGYFTCGNATELARLIERAHSDLAFFDRLTTQCQRRQSLFLPTEERAGVFALAQRLFAT